MTKSVYIHIPFCKSKCKYCSFTSFGIEPDEEYFKALTEEIKYYYEGEHLSTLYFGGGTPSLLNPKTLEELLSNFNYNNDCEITMELNPDDINIDYLKDIKSIGINRLSIGTQTFNDDILKIIGRRHDSNQAINAVKSAQEVGFENISIDLMYGLPTQTLKILTEDIQQAITLTPQHISTYGLKIEEGSYFYKYFPSNLPDNDMQADMYELLNTIFENNDYKRYEFSNFAKQGFESRHNLNYWNNYEYYGFGVSAHGYKNNIRYSNTTNYKDYINNPIKFESENLLNLSQQIEEEIFLGFRKTQGININKFKEKFGIDFEKEYAEIIKKYSPEFITKINENYSLTLKGVLLSNIILSEFLK